MKSWQIIAILALVLVTETAAIAPLVWAPSQRFMASVLPSIVIDYANTDRAKVKEGTLRENPLLAKAAEEKAIDMATRGYFSHVGPNGETPWTWLDKVGYNYVYAGENLAVNFFDSADVHRAWMNSPAHRENLLDKKFTEVGVGMAPGKFEGRDSLYIVEFFGSTEESLALAPTLNVARKDNSSLLSAVASLPDRALSINRQFVLSLLSLFGFEPIAGKII